MVQDIEGRCIPPVFRCPDSRVVAYRDDGFNRRVEKSINGVVVQRFVYMNELEPVAELDAIGNVVSTFAYADRANTPSLMRRAGATYRIIADQLGSIRLVVDIATGQITQRIDYDEFGNVSQDTNPGFQPFGFAGGIYDRDTELVRLGARDYDPVAGRWTAKDPAGFGGGENLYEYGAGDPINMVDVTGETPAHVVLGFAVAYARCTASCTALSGLSAALLSECDVDLPSLTSDCASSCFNPLNWLKIGVAEKGLPKAGRYEFPDKAAGNRPYVGQSGNIPKRLAKHERDGRYAPGTATTTEVAGGRTAREISEHLRIREITGGVPARQSNAVSNQIDPVGPARQYLLPGG